VTLTLRRQEPEAEDVPLPGMIGEHPLMKEVYRLVRRVAPTELPVAIVGETGTGKELVAKAIHALGPSPEGALVDLNCAGLPEHLVDGELFGWEQGAFTGAHRRVQGLLELAGGGTLFLDEACGLPEAVQAKLLRAIEQGAHRRLGGRAPVAARFRLILAITERPDALVARRAWRRDFAHRVSDVVVELPPLRSRRNDLALLAKAFLARSGEAVRLSEGALGRLLEHEWPGNVRELQRLVNRLVVLAGGDVISEWDVAAQLGVGAQHDLVKAVAAHGGNLSQAARSLGLPRSTLRRRLRRPEGGGRGH
jgi:two-component system NtrC family response regulator